MPIGDTTVNMKRSKRKKQKSRAELEMDEEEQKDAEYMSKIMGALKKKLKQKTSDGPSGASGPEQQNLHDENPRDPSLDIQYHENLQDNYQSTDPQVLALDEYLNSNYYKQKKINQERSWLEVVGKMFNAFMVCARKASQWGNMNLCDKDWKIPCKCSERQFRIRNIVLVDILSKHFLIFWEKLQRSRFFMMITHFSFSTGRERS